MQIDEWQSLQYKDIPLAFIVIAVSTLNLWMAFLCALTIFGIITTVMALGAKGMLGWHLGTAETVAAVITIGFSVDYCVLLANAYTESEARSRSGRVRDALAPSVSASHPAPQPHSSAESGCGH